MMYWPWDLIGENMQLCLAGLRDVDRLVNTGMAGKRVGYREPIKNIDYELHASRVSNTPFDSCY